MGLNAYAGILLILGAVLGGVEFFRTKRVGDLAITFLALGVAAAFFASGSEPLLHP